MIPEREPRENRIRQRALEIYEDRMATGEPGDAPSDWFAAEREIDEEDRERTDS